MYDCNGLAMGLQWVCNGSAMGLQWVCNAGAVASMYELGKFARVARGCGAPAARGGGERQM